MARDRRDPSCRSALRFARDGEAIAIGDLELAPYTVPHDAAEPLQLRCSDGDARLGVLTEPARSRRTCSTHLRGCDALLLECNHDAAMLAALALPAVAEGAHRRPLRPLATTLAARSSRPGCAAGCATSSPRT